LSFVQKDTIPAWQKLYNAFHSKAYGEYITHGDIKMVLGGMYESWRGPIYKFTKVLEELDKKSIKNDRKKGYLICYPNEHTFLGRKRVLRSRRQLVKGRHTLNATNIVVLTHNERQELIDMQQRLQWIISAANKRKFEAVKEKKSVPIKTDLEDIEMRFGAVKRLTQKKKKKIRTGT